MMSQRRRASRASDDTVEGSSQESPTRYLAHGMRCRVILSCRRPILDFGFQVCEVLCALASATEAGWQ